MGKLHSLIVNKSNESVTSSNVFLIYEKYQNLIIPQRYALASCSSLITLIRYRRKLQRRDKISNQFACLSNREAKGTNSITLRT